MASIEDSPEGEEIAPAPPTPPKRGPGHRGQDVRDTMAEMAAKAHEISLEAGSRMTATMREVIGAAAGLTAFAIESARDLVQYMVRRGQMSQDEADKLMREVEAAHASAPKGPGKSEAAKAEPAKKAASLADDMMSLAPPVVPRPNKVAAPSVQAAKPSVEKGAKAPTKPADAGPEKGAAEKAVEKPAEKVAEKGASAPAEKAAPKPAQAKPAPTAPSKVATPAAKPAAKPSATPAPSATKAPAAPAAKPPASPAAKPPAAPAAKATTAAKAPAAKAPAKGAPKAAPAGKSAPAAAKKPAAKKK